MAARKAGRKGAAGGAGGNAPWVATGAAADAQYSEARVVARDHMRLRNQLFQQVRPNGVLESIRAVSVRPVTVKGLESWPCDCWPMAAALCLRIAARAI